MTQNKKPRLSPQWIDPRAYKIVETLQKRGHVCYLVGGCVRDLLLGIEPKDYDIATTALPPEVKRALPQSYIIGRRFRLVLVKRDDQQFEVATFRREAREEDNLEELPPGDNLWGTPEDDAKRRDFTINALFYDPVANKLIDYAEGKYDLQEGLIRIIGDPQTRLLEDPIRILRAIRLVHKIRFSLDRKLRAAIEQNAHCLENSALPRRREELLKFLRLKEPLLPLLDCFDLGVLKYISPTIHQVIENPKSRTEFVRYLQNYHDYYIDGERPLDLFAMLCLAIIRSLFPDDFHFEVKSHDLLEHEKIKSFMKDELGMFNYEQIAFAKALQMQSILTKHESFSSKGHRRKLAVLGSEVFPLSLAIAQRDHSLRPEQVVYWRGEYQNLLPEILDEQKTVMLRKRTKRSRRKPMKKNLAKPTH